MKLILIMCSVILGAWAKPRFDPSYIIEFDDEANQATTKPTLEVEVERSFPTTSYPHFGTIFPRTTSENSIYPELLFNSEASPALPPFPVGTTPTTKPPISVTIPIIKESLPSPTTTSQPEPIASASSSPQSFILPIRGANPSLQLIPPVVNPTTPTTLTPRNLHDIPLSLVSLSGNSGATTSSEEQTPEQMGVDFTKFRYHVETGKLVKIGSTGDGVCPKNMRFFAVPGHAKNGACDCDYYQCSRPLIYSPEKHQCFYAWSQGPCAQGEWFVFNKDLRKRGSCVKNPCPPEINNGTVSSSSDYFYLNPEDETCYEAGTQGYCKDADERLLIFPGEPIPKCRKFTLCYPLTVPQELQCIFGNKYFVESGHC